MHLVAVHALAATSSLEAESPLLASDLAITTYDARLLLAAGFPAIVLRTGDVERARALRDRLEARGHDASVCAGHEIPSSSTMLALRRFRAGDAALIALDVHGGEIERVPYADILCLLRATHRRSFASETRSETKSFSAGRALVTGGVLVTKTVVTKESRAGESRENVLYVLRHRGERGWLLRESGLEYAGLGASMGKTQPENFARTIELLRARAPNAPYDDRIARLKRIAEISTLQGAGPSSTTVQSSSEAGVDALVHLLSLTISRHFRGSGVAP